MKTQRSRRKSSQTSKTSSVRQEDAPDGPSHLVTFLDDLRASASRVEECIASYDDHFGNRDDFANAPVPLSRTGDVFMDYYNVALQNERVQEELEEAQQWLVSFASESNKAFDDFAKRKPPPTPTAATVAANDQDVLSENEEEMGREKERPELDITPEDGDVEDEDEVDDDEEKRMSRFPDPSSFNKFRTTSDRTFDDLLKRCETARRQCVSDWAAKLVAETELLASQREQIEGRIVCLDKEIAELHESIQVCDGEINRSNLGAARQKQSIEMRLRPTVLAMGDYAREQGLALDAMRERLSGSEEHRDKLRSVYDEINKCAEAGADLKDRTLWQNARRSGAAFLAECDERGKVSAALVDGLLEKGNDKYSTMAQGREDDYALLDKKTREEKQVQQNLDEFNASMASEKASRTIVARELKVQHAIMTEKKNRLEAIAKEQRREDRRKVYMDLLRQRSREREKDPPHFPRSKRSRGSDDSLEGPEGIFDPYAGPGTSSSPSSSLPCAVDDFDSGDEAFDSNPVLTKQPEGDDNAGKTVLAVVGASTVDPETDRALGGWNESDRIRATLLTNAKMIVKSAQTAKNLLLKVPEMKYQDVVARLDVPAEENIRVEGSVTVRKNFSCPLSAVCYGLYSAPFSIHLLNSARQVRLETVSFDATSFVPAISPQEKQRNPKLSQILEIDESLSGPQKFLIDLSSFEENIDDPKTFHPFGLEDVDAFMLGDVLAVIRRAVQSLLDSEVVDAQIGSFLEQLDFIERIQRTIVPGPTAGQRQLEQTVGTLCLGVIESAMEKAPRILFVRNDRRLLSATLLPVFALLNVVFCYCSPSSPFQEAQAAEPLAEAAAEHNHLVFSRTSLLVVTLVACGTQYPEMPRKRGGKGKSRRSGAAQVNSILSATEFVKTLRRACVGLLASSTHRHATSLEALDAAIGKFIQASEEADELADKSGEAMTVNSDQAASFSAFHRHAIVGCMLYLLYACGREEPPKEPVLLDIFNQGVKQLEERMFSDHGIISQKPVIATWNMQKLLSQTSPEMVPAIIALDLHRRLLDEELKRQHFVRDIARGKHADLRFLNVTMSRRLEANLRKQTKQFLSDGLGIDEDAARRLPKAAQHRVWLEGLSRVVNEQCSRVSDLAWGAMDEKEKIKIMPGDNIALPPKVRAQLIDHVQQLQFLCNARLEDGQEQTRALYSNLVACAKAVHDAVESSQKVVRVFEEPLLQRLAWAHKQAASLGRECTLRRLTLQEKRATVSSNARNVSILRESIALYGNPHKEPHKSRYLSPEVRKILLDPDDDGLGPVLVVLRSQRQVSLDETARALALISGLEHEIAELQSKISVLKRRLADLAGVDFNYGPRIADLLARLLEQHTPVSVQEPAALQPDDDDKQSQTLQVFQKSMEARSIEAQRSRDEGGRTGLFYVEPESEPPVVTKPASENSSSNSSKKDYQKERTVAVVSHDDVPRTLLQNPNFKRHYESIVTVTPSLDGKTSTQKPNLSLAPVPSPLVGVPPHVRSLLSRAPVVRSSSSFGFKPALGSKSSGLVPGEKIIDSGWLLDLSLALPTELRFDTLEDRQRFEELFGITLPPEAATVVESDEDRAARLRKAEAAQRQPEVLREGVGIVDVFVPKVVAGDVDEADEQAFMDAEDVGDQNKDEPNLRTPSFGPVAPPNNQPKQSFLSPLVRREKK